MNMGFSLVQWMLELLSMHEEARFNIQGASRGTSGSQFQHWNLFIHNIQQFEAERQKQKKTALILSVTT